MTGTHRLAVEVNEGSRRRRLMSSNTNNQLRLTDIDNSWGMSRINSGWQTMIEGEGDRRAQQNWNSASRGRCSYFGPIETPFAWAISFGPSFSLHPCQSTWRDPSKWGIPRRHRHHHQCWRHCCLSSIIYCPRYLGIPQDRVFLILDIILHPSKYSSLLIHTLS